mmetsp:Transcript_54008/g.85962  ORF Transcript_54008/g.85962 Transcript_54008/m.85962 type:complete len:115 (+) Transcript_54008:99-443(+)|eukprot:CAMPEP_0169114642 /NCGR_PEP_ID=MMETSP1015-20121227/28877_1 /TAXON_ID=342587 /ORGANISM="Karlodinium micrum, Strain CCMP2283" /LENGTH=114 /DNA_ID=CAMNT_0009176959 /DNA_START=86 /DNA_END=430 /DNA_ORIENTATION=-
MQLQRFLCVVSVLAAGAAAASNFLARTGDTPEADRFALRSWLASHLKDHFELDTDSRLRQQSGLNIPWNWNDIRPRNAKNDCEDGPGQMVKKVTDDFAKAAQEGELKASRLSAK